MEEKKERFYKVYWSEMEIACSEDLTEQQKLTNKVYTSGAIALYTILIKFIARKNWTDKPGYPLKRDYFDKGMLACSFPKTVLMRYLDVGERKIEGWVKILKAAGWIKTNNKAFKAQTVFVLGKHSGSGKDYREELFKDANIEIIESKSDLNKRINKNISDNFMLRLKLAKSKKLAS